MLLCILMWESLSGLNEKATLSTSYTRKKCRAKLLSCRLRVIYSVEIFPHSLQTLVYIFFSFSKNRFNPLKRFLYYSPGKRVSFFWWKGLDGTFWRRNQNEQSETFSNLEQFHRWRNFWDVTWEKNLWHEEFENFLGWNTISSKFSYIWKW